MSRRSVAAAVVCGLATGAALAAAEWPDWRGPRRDGVSLETNLPVKWSPSGENLAWRAPYGSRSAPIVLGDRVFLLNTAAQGDRMQERVMCLDAASGKVVWEHRYSIYHSDVPPHRVGWASPVADPATGNIYAYGVGGKLTALTRDGKVLWERSLVEEYGFVTTHGGRTVSPIVEGDLVILSSLNAGWGDLARTGNRYFGIDKRTGQTVWVSSPQSRHYDTNNSSPIAADINGTRLIIVGGTDGAIHAIKAQTGEPVWKFEMSKRAINTNVVMKGTDAIVTHSEENLDTSEMGLIAAVDATAKGEIGPAAIRWRTHGFQGGFSSPVIDGDRLYQVDNGAVLAAFDLASGRKLWDRNLGTIQKSSPVFADGKLYVGTENGRFYILRPGPTGVEVLDEDLLGTGPMPEPIIASPAVANGRVYVASMEALYAIGKGTAGRASSTGRAVAPVPSSDPPAHVQVFPFESIVRPGDAVQFHARLFDAKGRFVREEKAAWTLEQVQGTIAENGAFTAASGSAASAGLVKATVGGLTGSARIRVVPPLPWSFDFDQTTGDAPPRHWVNATGRFVVRDVAGGRALFRAADSTVARRVRVFFGPTDLSDYAVEADLRVTQRRRQMSDVGVIAQRYALVLFGNSQKIELQAWQPATAMTVSAPFAWKGDTWYRVKLQAENLPDGTTRVRGKAWPAGEAEPGAWLVEKVDRIPHRQGSPGLYADAATDLMFDNIRVYRPQGGTAARPDRALNQP